MISNRVLWKWRAKTLSKQWTCSLNLCAADAPMLCCIAVKHQRCCHWGDRAELLSTALRICKSILTVAGPTGACHNPQDVTWITHLEKAHVRHTRTTSRFQVANGSRFVFAGVGSCTCFSALEGSGGRHEFNSRLPNASFLESWMVTSICSSL